jgi:hypothetical protein
MNSTTQQAWTWWVRYVAAVAFPVVVCADTVLVGELFPRTVLTVAWEILVYAASAVALWTTWRLLLRRVKGNSMRVLGLVPTLGWVCLFAALSNATPKCEYSKPRYIGPQPESAVVVASCER